MFQLDLINKGHSGKQQKKKWLSLSTKLDDLKDQKKNVNNQARVKDFKTSKNNRRNFLRSQIMIELNTQHPAHTPVQEKIKESNRDFSI